jgi:hypothetical protein
VTNHFATFSVFDLHPRAVDAIPIFNRHIWVALREMFDLRARFLGLIEFGRELLREFVVKHGCWFFKNQKVCVAAQGLANSG